ncbi:hypothetical protein [Streptomyces sp. NBC_01443]|uniref:hypothetical protein n=1 Tax=Streptomyces sp. NBC_01443 TaxID=2903868 RepID=UPI00225180E5|nr:hypothetical protein [Streptomyces sp. NBC_01443]MCX4628275.1 hypothetical protein [Streptomyces sp. NBC_01443]
MKIAKRIGTLAAAALTVVTGTIAFASSAEAAGSWKCRFYNEGNACVRTVGNGYDVQYIKHWDDGHAHYIDFNLECQNGYTYGDNGAFWINPSETRSYVFAVGARGTCRAKVIDHTSGKTFYSDFTTKLG